MRNWLQHICRVLQEVLLTCDHAYHFCHILQILGLAEVNRIIVTAIISLHHVASRLSTLQRQKNSLELPSSRNLCVTRSVRCLLSLCLFFQCSKLLSLLPGGSWLLAVIVILLHHADLIVSYCITKATIAINKQDLGFLGYNDGSGLYLFSDKKWCRQCCPHWCSSAYLVRLGLGSRHELCQCTCPGTPVTPEMV